MLDGLNALSGFEDQFRALLERASLTPSHNSNREQFESTLKQLGSQKQNLIDAIAKLGLNVAVEEKLRQVEDEERLVNYQLELLTYREQRQADLLASTADLRLQIEEAFSSLSPDTYEFGYFLRQFVPEFYVYSVRLGGEGPLLPRARLKLDLAGHLDLTSFGAAVRDLTTRWVTIDLFERPLQEVILQDVVRLAGDKPSPKRIAATLGGAVADRHVNKALKLHRRMTELELSDPYVLVAEPPDDLKKLKRSVHPRYSFSSIEGYDRPELG